MSIMIVIVQDKRGNVGSVIPYVGEETAVADYLAAKAELEPGERVSLFYANGAGEPCVRLERQRTGPVHA